MGFWRLTLQLLIIPYISRWIYLYLLDLGVGINFNKVTPGPCRVIPGISCGSEQISVTKDGLAFITNGFRGVTTCNKKYLKGRMYLFDFNKPDENVTELKIESDTLDNDVFDPHGMDIIEETGNVKVYVVNHHLEESVEVFIFNKDNRKVLKHVKTIRDENFVCLNDITLLDENSFYVTNYLRFCKLFHSFIVEYFLSLPTATIVYYSLGKSSIVFSGENMLNGISLDNDRKGVFTISSKTGEILEFLKDDANGSLSLVKRHWTGFHSDNIFLDKFAGAFYISMQKAPIDALLFIQNLTDYCPATGAKVKVSQENSIEVEEILHLPGKDFVSGLSVVAHYKGQYLFGTVCDSLGYCIDRSAIPLK